MVNDAAFQASLMANSFGKTDVFLFFPTYDEMWIKTLLIRQCSGSRMFLGLLDPDPLVKGTDPDPASDPPIIKQK